jgi:hypothetical protein
VPIDDDGHPGRSKFHQPTLLTPATPIANALRPAKQGIQSSRTPFAARVPQN